jgi:hypothetical protein
LKIFIERLENIEEKLNIFAEELKELRKDNEKLVELLKETNVDNDFIMVSIFRIFNYIITENFLVRRLA